jgi:hypothetical protein
LAWVSLINFVNLIISLENKNIDNKQNEKKQQRFNVKDECLSILWKYIFKIFQKHHNDLIC